MELEKLATSAVITELSKTDRLSSFINSGDKEPCWDGNIYIHEDKSRTKKNIKKVATQVKGKAVNPNKVKRTINYPISHDDIYAYMMNGGTMFFVVYLDKKTGNPLQVYYADLLPIKIKEITKLKKTKYSVKCRKFPLDNLQKTELLLNFYDNAQRQASFAGKDLPTVEQLAKDGVLESLSIHYTGLGNYDTHNAFPKMLDGKSLTIYANIKGGTAPIPVEYYETVSQVTMTNKNTLPISVNGRPYYVGFSVVTTAENVELHIGSSVRIIFPNTGRTDTPVSVSIKVCIKGTLREQITAIEFVTAMIEHGSFCIGTSEIPSKFPQEELDRINAAAFPEILKGYKRAKEVLDSMNVKKDLKISECTDEDIDNLNLLIGTIGDRKLAKGNPNAPAQVTKLKIANLTLVIVYLENEKGGYNVWDYFGHHFCVSWKDDSGERRISQFSTMVADDFLNLDNLNLDTIITDYRMIEPSDWLFELGNATMLEMLKAYDKKPSVELLDAAKKMLEWMSENPEYTTAEVNLLNKLQIALRERKLTFSEKAELHTTITNTTDAFFKIGAFLLLDEQDEAKALLDTLEPKQLEKFKEFPIYRFYKEAEEETNG